MRATWRNLRNWLHQRRAFHDETPKHVAEGTVIEQIGDPVYVDDFDAVWDDQ